MTQRQFRLFGQNQQSPMMTSVSMQTDQMTAQQPSTQPDNGGVQDGFALQQTPGVTVTCLPSGLPTPTSA